MRGYGLIFTLMLTIAPVVTLAQEGAAPPAQAPRVDARIYILASASPLERFAAHEIRRYVYLSTGRLLPFENVGALPPSARGILVGPGPATKRDAELKLDEYLIQSGAADQPLVTVAGGSELATLYGAYRYAELLGVRFYMDGDVIPDAKTELKLTGISERRRPLFELRGIQPFHDFPEGPDWWDLDNYKAIIGQLPKLGMNFIGLHCYPEGHPLAEPTVWIGPAGEMNADGSVKASYPSSYQNTLRTSWGYLGTPTSRYVYGGASLFESDDYGPAVMRSACPTPQTPGLQNAVFNRTAEMLRAAFEFAHRLGVKTCVGTETPLTVPKAVAERLPAEQDQAARAKALYEGIFTRIMKAYPLDFYWFWTPEGWTWQGTNEAQVQATMKDLQTAIEAAKRVNAPFRLATCGWVLGPQTDRAMFDRVLPEEVAISCINRQVGNTPVDAGFAAVQRTDKWAIPWLEDDGALTSMQLWAGRMRRDAADALAYGCNGLMGIHWRTRILGPNVSALAMAAWDQTGWKKEAAPVTHEVVGGNVAAFPGAEIADTEDDPLYNTVRYDMSAYRLVVPNGTYAVTLKFCEPHYGEAGKRVFGVKLQNKAVIKHLDIFAKVGKNRALDQRFEGVQVTDGRLEIGFTHEVEYPCIAAIAVEGQSFSLKINCGGPAYKDYIPDPVEAVRGLPVKDFYADWAKVNFGPTVAGDIAAIFERLDCKLPRPTTWVRGPGGVQPDKRPWQEVRPEYAFVDDLINLRGKVQGAGNLERFDYWLNNFRYMRAIAWTNCLWAQFNAAMEQVRKESDPQKRKQLAREVALPLRRGMMFAVEDVSKYLLATVSNTGEMGMVMNLNTHILPDWLPEKVDAELSAALGEALPADAQLRPVYTGVPRVIVPTVRTSLDAGEPLVLEVILLHETPTATAPASEAEQSPGASSTGGQRQRRSASQRATASVPRPNASARERQTGVPRPRISAGGPAGTSGANNLAPLETALFWRPLGQREFQRIPLEHVARGVYKVSLPPASTGADFEYYVEAKWPDATTRFPAAAPEQCQTVVIMPGS